jgi:hypothetical protein
VEGREAASQYPYTREESGIFRSRLPETKVPGVSTFDGLRRNRAHARLRDSWLREIVSPPGANPTGIWRSNRACKTSNFVELQDHPRRGFDAGNLGGMD